MPVQALQAPRTAIYQLADPIDRFHTVEEVRGARDLPDALSKLQDPDCDPGRCAIAEGARNDRYAPGRVRILEAQPAKIELEVDASAGAAFLVASISFLPGWTAGVDGERATIYPANGATLGLPVPRGAHRVVLTYRERTFGWGAGISIFSGLLLIAWVVADRVKGRPA